MKHISIIGIGTGNPEHVTMQAIKAMNAAEVIFLPLKGAGKEELAEIRREICERYVTRSGTRVAEFEVPQRQIADRTYAQSVDAWHGQIANIYRELISGLPDGGTGAFLVWGDPSLYDSTIRIIERVRQSNSIDFDYSVVPGITSIQALAASHKIPLNLVGKPVEITTGRRLAQDGLQSDSTVVMLDGEQAFAKVDDPDAEIFWGAYLGTGDEIIRSGRLGDIAADIQALRTEARRRHGWIMDIYLLRKGRDFEE
ncbi:precorrin-6A synthase (deacetylating) [Rhizobium bangladeshense]|uniref:Precorrin-6A synthase [deacetylating] n=1 Tax=Rhizobium bangladeshense TaxID=1138189 RepID=A0ABS7LFA2_9HYPH|nr:precorrin-6A synthase (deacetylating) [Rhizobium bangladeshense]MBX4868320.1 precorrin-6A synthase (deacetylating) [Rhizobium bangladeshense]MBX4875860.1 precorrin-6A synthase (deacetylating) [Rhizobium bangladeshense]MBX4886828.1 precorrin-6A synthase (deacetylating) [Rhizobium bangladeshense]MBX4894460.1 precorrin-6A synthase (deacetylating) [Rhizobium bangladeshense]MBX4903653.1 precorrin-6A synthase (deacetylating) [Rhizobium bangladeshense]